MPSPARAILNTRWLGGNGDCSGRLSAERQNAAQWRPTAVRTRDQPAKPRVLAAAISRARDTPVPPPPRSGNIDSGGVP